MIVYDVVYEVTPDATRISSYKPGVWQAGHIDFDRERAERFAAEYNRHCRIPGVVWDVVKDGVCVTQRAGLSGAKSFIEEQVCRENSTK